MAQSENKNGHSISLGASFGLLNGESEEIVYRSAGSKDKLSQLLWNFRPLVYAGAELHYNWRLSAGKKNIFADALSKFGIPGITGSEEDRDWMYNANWLSHYSVHDNRTENAIQIDVKAGMAFTIFEQFLLKTYISYDFMYFSWTAKGGSFLYPTDDGGHSYLLSSRDTGKYKQVWNLLSPGVSFYGAFNRYFDIELFFDLSPLVWLAARDEHIERNLVIHDALFGGLSVEPGLLFSFKPGGSMTWSLSLDYRRIFGTRGDGVYKEQGKPAITAGEMAGAGYSAFDAAITVKYKFF